MELEFFCLWLKCYSRIAKCVKLQVMTFLLQYSNNFPCYARYIAQNYRCSSIYYSTGTMLHITQDTELKIAGVILRGPFRN